MVFGFGKKNVVQTQISGDNSINIQVAGNLPISLEKKRDAARLSLSKEVPFSLRMSVMAFVDASGSMSGFYRRGIVQELTERALGFALAMDDDGEIPVYGFGSEHKHYGDINAQNYLGFVDRSGLGPHGSTNLSDSLAYLEKVAKKATEPIYALIVTDGAPNNRTDVEARMRRLSTLPVFIKILVVGNDSDAWSFVRDHLDDNDFPIDNVDGQKINDPSQLTDQQFADKMVEELAGWYRLAKDSNLL